MTLSQDPKMCAELGQRARQRLEQQFTWQAIAAQYDSLYRETALADS
jgi:glycosyltransferase involved in cell wall biosynthesis